MAITIDLEVFRSHLLRMTELLTVETAALLAERPRFSHSVLLLANHDSGERFKTNCIRQLDPFDISTSKIPESTYLKKQKNSSIQKIDVPCLLCRENEHNETAHFQQNNTKIQNIECTDENNNYKKSHVNISPDSNWKSNSTHKIPRVYSTESFNDRVEHFQFATSSKPWFATRDSANTNCTTEKFRNHVNTQSIYRKSPFNQGDFPSEKREKYSKWRANIEFTKQNKPTLIPIESHIINTKTHSTTVNNVDQEMSRKNESAVTDRLINEAIRILEASCHMLEDTTKKLNYKKEVISTDLFSRNKLQTSSLNFPSVNRQYSADEYLSTTYRRQPFFRNYEAGDVLSKTTVTTKLIHEKIVETIKQL